MPPFEPQIHHFGVARPTPSRAIGREIATKVAISVFHHADFLKAKADDLRAQARELDEASERIKLSISEIHGELGDSLEAIETRQINKYIRREETWANNLDGADEAKRINAGLTVDGIESSDFAELLVIPGGGPAAGGAFKCSKGRLACRYHNLYTKLRRVDGGKAATDKVDSAFCALWRNLFDERQPSWAEVCRIAHEHRAVVTDAD